MRSLAPEPRAGHSPASELAVRRGVCTDGSRWPTEPAARAGRGWASARAQAGSPRGEAGARPGGVSPPHACLRSGRGEPPNLTGSGLAPAPGVAVHPTPLFPARRRPLAACRGGAPCLRRQITGTFAWVEARSCYIKKPEQELSGCPSAGSEALSDLPQSGLKTKTKTRGSAAYAAGPRLNSKQQGHLYLKSD